MAETHHKKQLIKAALASLRIQVQKEASFLRRKLDMKPHVLELIKKHPWKWASCAAIVGWLLSHLPVRKKRVYTDSASQQPAKRRDKPLLSKVWREVWQFSKPMIAAYLANLLAEHAKSPESKWDKAGSAKDISV